jgi:uncharacterized repeat protein (TIGR03803 family)
MRSSKPRKAGNVKHCQSGSTIPSLRLPSVSLLVLLFLTCWLGFPGHARAQYSVTIVHSFGDGSVTNDGSEPVTGLIQASNGNFYGATPGGGINYGVVYQMTPTGTVAILHSFSNSPTDGYQPMASLIQASDGYLYGTSSAAGAYSYGCIFKLLPDGTSYSLAASFNYPTGGNPRSGLTQGIDGNLYGTLWDFGTYSGGAAFSFSSPTINNGTGAVSYLHEFGSVSNEGINPVGGMVQDAGGNFYGITEYGGSTGEGTVFRMTGSGTPPTWTVTTLHSFGAIPNDGTPSAGFVQTLVLGSDGNLYGTTPGGGSASSGTVFKITAPSSASPSYLILHTFGDGSVANDGLNPQAGLTQASDGNFYGTTTSGGTTASPHPFVGYGTVFEITPSGLVTILHSFGDGSVLNDGTNPTANLIQGTDGLLYGTTSAGGSAHIGTIFKIAPPQSPSILLPPSVEFVVGQHGSVPTSVTGNPPPTVSATGLPSWASLNTSTGLISGTPPNTAGSPFSVTLTASNGVGSPATANLQIFVEQSSNTYATWASTFFTPTQMSNPTISGERATPQNDRTANLLKYAFDIDPNEVMSAADLAALPTPGSTTISGQLYLTLTFRKNVSASDLTYYVQTSPDLLTWQTVTPQFTNTLRYDPTSGYPIIQVGVNVTASPYYFIRLQIASP